jgi:hypothetical protein
MVNDAKKSTKEMKIHEIRGKIVSTHHHSSTIMVGPTGLATCAQDLCD